ncbi:MAG: cyclic lactone autoinducer peptide [Sporomusa sp.]
MVEAVFIVGCSGNGCDQFYPAVCHILSVQREGGREVNLLSRIGRLLLGNMASVILFMALFAANTRSGVHHEPKVPSKLRKS